MKMLLIVVSFLLAATTVILSQPYAPVAPTPKNLNNDPEIKLWAAFIKDVKVPDKKTIPFPAYPGAEIIQTTSAQSEQRQDELFYSIRLVTKDEQKSVIDFYKKELKDWNNEDVYGTYLFWKADNQMKALVGSEPAVHIENADKFKKSFPSANSVITIFYKVKN